MGFLEEVDAGTSLLAKIWPFIKKFFGTKDNNEYFCNDYYYEEYNKKIYIKDLQGLERITK